MADKKSDKKSEPSVAERAGKVAYATMMYPVIAAGKYGLRSEREKDAAERGTRWARKNIATGGKWDGDGPPAELSDAAKERLREKNMPEFKNGGPVHAEYAPRSSGKRDYPKKKRGA